jgi:hypothetical protein
MNMAIERWHAEFKPLSEAAEEWEQLLLDAPGALLYHSRKWIEVLRKAYDLKPTVVLAVDQAGNTGAGCIFATVGLPLRRRSVALPFSDSCPPIAVDKSAARELILALRNNALARGGFELRGVAASEPWQVVNCFVDWHLPLRGSLASIQAGASKHFARQMRHAVKEGIAIEHGSDLNRLKRFYRLMLLTRRRQGIPPPPFRLFESVEEVFGSACETWLATKQGKDLAGLVVLRYGDRLHYRWGARIDDPSGANHLLFWNLIEKYASDFRVLDLGRTDYRNAGLCRFKRELGAVSAPLSYSYFPSVGEQVSAETLSGPARLASRVWRHLPLPVTRVLGTAIYRFCA